MKPTPIKVLTPKKMKTQPRFDSDGIPLGKRAMQPACGTGGFLGRAVKNGVYKTPRELVKAVKGKIKLTCPTCKKPFTPHRIDQTCCSVACRAKSPRTTYPKYDAEAAKVKRDELKARGMFRPVVIQKPTKAEIKADFARRGKLVTQPDPVGLEGIKEFVQARREYQEVRNV